ncbi:hypothetical protein GUITHDRAFT_133552 [Guillardia theta CCMP2712]|uniref:Uncharacterized protein n=1 Tax=Guillardia theta (strain CCMP2712) TaxID=905079 RepID=L1JW83_GUITC|nr:hypothetical protein GUITHDRAFT_133552 [Guillardia theta CCMP2712]EKX52465.1 hypothetical protein GUITHDRAFT_133552 [Guillardia theta CCMP2712]|eukprot:XP_005839445.1 hypothetical protein GUITHDRAFT_133552 [Guillardia theta CCMP2712]
MDTAERQLPSVSSLLQWARSENQNAAQRNFPLSFHLRGDVKVQQQSLLGGEGEWRGLPLPESVIDQAMQELPQGSRVALHSCIFAYKERRLSDTDFLHFAKSLSSPDPCRCSSQSMSLMSALNPQLLGQPAMGFLHRGFDPRLTLTSQPPPLPPPHALSPHSLVPAVSGYCPDAAESVYPAKRQRVGEQQVVVEGAIRSLLQQEEHGVAWKRPAFPLNLNLSSLPMQLLAENAQVSMQSNSSSSSSTSPGSLSGVITPTSKILALRQIVTAKEEEPREAGEEEIEDKLKKLGELASSMSASKEPPSKPAEGKEEAEGKELGKEAREERVIKTGVEAPLLSMWVGGSHLVESFGSEENSAHNKYCHFCQHIKVKRASSMLACENRGCNRRFCEHCLNTHIADPSSTVEWRRRGIPWHCPICRKTCCCAMRECGKSHRHCKAYRYRRKRAQQAEVDTSPTPELPSMQPSIPSTS